ncbi:hypothetical protein EDB89DRAFT_1907770 [Lactarius sanguifluus]|nr:hypothetical protein EDB89DRAFT_1907770 [Lactarius sanguifluus]
MCLCRRETRPRHSAAPVNHMTENSFRPIRQPSTRAYSLFSKPPGGRFFNSSKPPKVVPSASAKSPSRVEASTANNNSNSNDPQQASSSSPDDPSVPPSPVPSASPPHTPSLPAFASPPTVLASHPPLSAPDLRLHQFFAQHRPLVLSQPAAVLFDASPTLVLGPTRTQAPSAAPATLDNPPETTPEADADTARLLARALAMNAVSSSASWDATLHRLGLNPAEGRAAESAALEGLAVQLDSTHRKRRKKMKKHKLKKRRRLQRAQRLKIALNAIDIGHNTIHNKEAKMSLFLAFFHLIPGPIQVIPQSNFNTQNVDLLQNTSIRHVRVIYKVRVIKGVRRGTCSGVQGSTLPPPSSSGRGRGRHYHNQDTRLRRRRRRGTHCSVGLRWTPSGGGCEWTSDGEATWMVHAVLGRLLQST